MELVQIAASTERGAYYYDLSTDKVYHVPNEELLELNNIRFSRLLGLLICSALVVVVIVECAIFFQNIYEYYLHLLPLVVIAVFSSCGFWRLVKLHQKKLSYSIKNRRPISIKEINLMEEIKFGCKTYFQLGIYIVFLFCAAIFSLNLRSESPDILLDIFSVAFFDTSIMMIAILQPLRKVRVYLRIYNRRQ